MQSGRERPQQWVRAMSDGDDWRRARKSRGRRGGGADEFPGDDGGRSSPPSFGAAAPSWERQTSAPVSGPEDGAVVKRFDAERGFGFVVLDSGGGDAFLHISTLRGAGTETIGVGARLRVRVGQGQKGPQVIEVLEVREADHRSPLRADASERSGVPSGGGEEVRGTVRWYNAEKGFGFVTPEDGNRDVFVHATALERGGLPPLSEGQAVVLRVVHGRKGPEAETVSNP